MSDEASLPHNIPGTSQFYMDLNNRNGLSFFKDVFLYLNNSWPEVHITGKITIKGP